MAVCRVEPAYLGAEMQIDKLVNSKLSGTGCVPRKLFLQVPFVWWIVSYQGDGQAVCLHFYKWHLYMIDLSTFCSLHRSAYSISLLTLSTASKFYSLCTPALDQPLMGSSNQNCCFQNFEMNNLKLHEKSELKQLYLCHTFKADEMHSVVILRLP